MCVGCGQCSWGQNKKPVKLVAADRRCSNFHRRPTLAQVLRLSGQLFHFGPESVITQHEARVEGG